MDGMLGIIGGILIVLISLLITMILDMKKNLVQNDITTRKAFDEIREKLNQMVAWQDYKEDRKEVCLKLDDHGDRLLKLEIRVRLDDKGDK
jgi:hypothetical protein